MSSGGGLIVTPEIAKITRSFKESPKLITSILTPEIAKDMNFYAKEDKGGLKGSLQWTDKGQIAWNKDYAEYQFYNPNTKTLVNPNAVFEWSDFAEGKHGKNWEEDAFDLQEMALQDIF